jgi:hypothetical protein
MKPLLAWVGALALAAGLLFAAVPSSHAAPAQSLLPGLESNEDATITPSIAEGIATAIAAARGACSASAASACGPAIAASLRACERPSPPASCLRWRILLR